MRREEIFSLGTRLGEACGGKFHRWGTAQDSSPRNPTSRWRNKRSEVFQLNLIDDPACRNFLVCEHASHSCSKVFQSCPAEAIHRPNSFLDARKLFLSSRFLSHGMELLYRLLLDVALLLLMRSIMFPLETGVYSTIGLRFQLVFQLQVLE